MPPLNYYVSLLLRRRLPLLIAGMVIGAAVGWFTTPSASGDASLPSAPAFRATHTLVANDPGRTVNLDRLAFLAIVGEVPRAAAQDLDATPAELTSRLQISVRSDIQALQISAFDEDGERSVAIADRFAEGLLEMLTSQRTERIDDLSAQAATLRDEQAAADPGPAGNVERQRIQDELAIVLEQLRQASGQQVQLSSVEAAEPVAISETAYAAALDRIRTVGSIVSLDNAGSAGLQQLPTIDATADEPADEPAEAPRAAVGALVGLIAASALAIALDRLDPRIRTTEDVEQALGTPVLAEIPSFDRSQRGDQVVVHRHPHSRAAEAFRTLRTSIAPAGTFAGTGGQSTAAAAGGKTNGSEPIDRKGTVVLVTSPEPGDGKTTTVVNLAAAFAETGMRVLIVDADFRHPRSQAMLRPQSAQTLADALWPAAGAGRHEATPDFAALVSPTDLLGIGLLRAGHEGSVVINPSRLLITVKSACAWAVRHYDVVVVDTTALLGVNDARDVLPAADAVVLVVRRGSSTRDTAAQAGELLHRLTAPLTGAVFVEASSATQTRRSDFTRAGEAASARVSPREPLGL